MKDFENYLKRKGHSSKTRETYTSQLSHYLQWLESQQIEIIQTINTDVLAYMKYCSNKGNTQRTIQCRLGSVSHYYKHLKKKGVMTHDPIMGIEVKGIKRDILYQTLEPHELNNLYHKYPSDTPARKRNKVILGLLVYQGLRTRELSKLTTKNIKIREAEIHILRGRKNNERTLKLESHQILDVYDYLLQVRPKLAEGKEIELLFFNSSGSTRFSIIMHPITYWLKKKCQIESLNQIRASVITKWLKTYNLREAQHLAGHRYISSTERYLQNDLEGLQEEINQFHPLG